jgi:hypothetical protein
MDFLGGTRGMKKPDKRIKSNLLFHVLIPLLLKAVGAAKITSDRQVEINECYQGSGIRGSSKI